MNNKMAQKIYCGNNRLTECLTNNSCVLGTRYKCLKKGIGQGKNQPFDQSYLGPYEPIDNTRIYCGNQDNLPPEYIRFGTLTECLRKGVGIGKRLKALDGSDNNQQSIMHLFFIFFIIFISISLIVFISIWFIKPKFIIINDNNKNNIDKTKYISISISISIIISIIFFLIYKFLI